MIEPLRRWLETLGLPVEAKTYVMGRPMIKVNPEKIYTLEDIKSTRLGRYINFDGSEGCWEWNGYADKEGYGRVTWNRRPFFVHRLVYSLMKGEIQEEKILMHKCNTPWCCNPDHLVPGTQRENRLHAFGHTIPSMNSTPENGPAIPQ